ncbi:MAG: DUF86 domain-containing protein [Coriobacteriales bacterium]|jgi:uncharacterized protein with HEPN domain|nr:DUF86 domain-containing protein [Coriobacteriales bacterium]
MNDRDKRIIEKILKYINDIDSYLVGLDYYTFMSDSKTLAATAFALGQIGELTKEIQQATIDAYSDIPWKSLRGMRNRIVYDYDNADLKILWETASFDLPRLRVQLQDLL